MKASMKWGAAVLFLAVPVFADTIAFTAPGSLGASSGSPVNLGMVFTVSTAISVDSLGVYNMAGLTIAPTVGIYNSSGTLLTSAVVSLSDPVTNGYLFQSISPITLSPGIQYTVDEFSADGNWSSGTAPTTAAGVTFLSNTYVYASSLQFPTNTAGTANAAYYGPNFGFTSAASTPEPASLLLVGCGFAGLIGLVQSRRKSARISI